MEKLFDTDRMSKRERVEATLSHQPVDRVVLQDQLSYNPGVIAHYTGKPIQGFEYTIEDIGETIRKTLDACFPPVAPRGTERVTDSAGFVTQHDNWTSWHVSRPFADDDVDAWRQHVLRWTESIQQAPFDADEARAAHRERMGTIQRLVGETVIIPTDYSVGLCACWGRIGLMAYSYLYADSPEVISEFMDAFIAREVRRAHAIADPDLTPVILIADDFATKQGPIFSPDFLQREHFPRIRQLAEAWQSHGLKVLYHSDGNWKKVVPDLIACGVEGFYCLEPGVGMEIVELKNRWPEMVWAGGVDGVDLMERGTPEQVRVEVQRHIRETNALQAGGMFVGSSSEINPPIKPENYTAMVEAVGEISNLEIS
ncbi:MAG: hypothetical protein KAI66_08135 [Lentisphaeria bacterium]|nr:hypothetical protein [Lentisphaeria bacterium]